MKDLPIALFNVETDVASGQHTPSSENHWGMLNDVEEDLDEDLNLRKEALGLLDIPASTTGGEVLDFAGIPESPGLSQEQGEDEGTEFFGAHEEGMDLPPINNKYQGNKMAKTDLEDRKAKREALVKESQWRRT